MNRGKIVARLMVGIVVLAGAGVLTVSGILLDSVHTRSMRAHAADFAAACGLGTDLKSRRDMTGGVILEAFGVMKQGRAQGFVLRMECSGYSGKARFFSAYGTDGALKATAPMALTDAWPLKNEWPGVAACREIMQDHGPSVTDAKDGERSWDAETRIFLSSLGKSLHAGRAAVIRDRSAAK